jgi:hypothetical protein
LQLVRKATCDKLNSLNNYDRQTQESRRQIARSEPSIIRDKLSSDQWAAIAQYHEILKPLKDATKLLQGSAGGKTSAVWQALLTFEKSLAHFERLRVQYPITETCRNRSLLRFS